MGKGNGMKRMTKAQIESEAYRYWLGMKRMTKAQIESEAYRLWQIWLCRYGERDADKLSLAVRRLARKKNGG